MSKLETFVKEINGIKCRMIRLNPEYLKKKS